MLNNIFEVMNLSILDEDFIKEVKQDILSDIEAKQLEKNHTASIHSIDSIQSNNINRVIGTIITPSTITCFCIIIISSDNELDEVITSLSSKDIKKLENAQSQSKRQLEQCIMQAQNSIETRITLEQEKQSKIIEETLDIHLDQISNEIHDIKQLLKYVAYSSDLIINSMGAASQRTTREIIETQNLTKQYMELIKSNDPSKDKKLKKFVKELPKEVFISILGDVMKKFLGMP
jgi:hypothetical protein